MEDGRSAWAPEASATGWTDGASPSWRSGQACTSVGGVLDRVVARGREWAPLCKGDVNMKQPIQTEEERTMAMRVETDAAEQDQLAQSGLSTEEIGAFLWLRRWDQTGGRDRKALVRHWKFLKWLGRAGRLREEKETS